MGAFLIRVTLERLFPRNCVRILKNNKLYKRVKYFRGMEIKSTQILGAIVSVFGFILILSSILKYSIDFLPLEQDGLFAVGFVLLTMGLIIASKFSDNNFS